MANAYDVAVAGGGSAGVAAAVAAARTGSDVALVERQEILGGAGTTNLVNNFLNAYWDGERYIVGGIFMEIRHRLVGRKVLYQTRGPCQDGKHGQEPFDPTAYADELEIMCREAGVDLLLDATVTAAEHGDDRVHSLTLSDGSRIDADTFVDATGDAVLAHNTGVPTRMGSAEDGEIQPLTYTYVVGPVDLDALEQDIPSAIMYDHNTGDGWADLSHLEESNRRVEEAVAAGDVDFPVSAITTLRSVPGRPDHFSVNFGYVQLDDPTDEEQLAAATEEGKRQMRTGVEFLREYFPGFGDVKVQAEADRIGVRQSRTIEGLYELTGEDVGELRQFDDVIAQSCFPVDIHRAEGDWEWHEGGIPEGRHYDVPWRALVPRRGPENLVIAGRSISADHVALSTARVTPTVIAFGEAAGVTAALAAESSRAIASVGPDPVQERLRETQAILR